MPYVTPKMVQFMKEKGLTSSADSSENVSRSSDIVSTDSADGEKKRKVRELPSSVDPPDEDDSSDSDLTSKKPPQPGVLPPSWVYRHKSQTSNKPSSKENCSRTRTKSSINSNGRKLSYLKPLVVPGMNVRYNEMPFDEKRVKYIQTLLKSNVRQLYDIPPTLKVEENKDIFEGYFINEKKALPFKYHSAKFICEAQNYEYKDFLFVYKEYDSSWLPKHETYFKVLRWLAKKHPAIIHTWHVFQKGNNGKIQVFQELAPYGTLHYYISKRGTLDEDRCQMAARQLRHAMDYLGDMGLCHRTISPVHVLVIHATENFMVKLSGFRQACIYYNIRKDDIIYQPCFSYRKRSTVPDYYAPEMYGNIANEHYDPTAADVWSLGATLYYSSCKKYPYDTTKNNPKIENEIQRNVLNLKMSRNAQSAIGHMLTIYAASRISVEKLRDHPWIKEK